MKQNSLRVALCGVTAALALTLMLCTSVIPVGTYAFPCIAGILFVTIVIEFGEKWAFAALFAVALLSLFLAGDKEASIYFIAFFGYYPILKSLIERFKSRAVQWALKFSVFNAAMIAAFFVCKFILQIPDEEFTIFGLYIPWVFLIMGEIFFPLYDILCSMLIVRYVRDLRNRLFKNKP